jgi:uncharacterized cofD-like protein
MRQLNIVCFGGATGMSSVLSGLKKNPWINVTAIVSMFDSGGSSGVLRDRFGILPPSDVMRCLVALSEDETVARKILMKRIENDAQPGHTGGNLLLLSLERMYGNYPDAVDALAQILSARGRVVPVALIQSSLKAVYTDGSRAEHEADVDVGMRAGKVVEHLFLDPDVPASAEAFKAIKDADVFVIGPGSLYTSVLPSLLPIGIRDALSASSAPIFFIGNLLIEGQGMSQLSVNDNVRLAEALTGRRFEAVICNTQLPEQETLDRYAQEQKTPLLASDRDQTELGTRLVPADLWTDPTIARHDSDRLAQLIFALAQTHLSRRT